MLTKSKRANAQSDTDRQKHTNKQKGGSKNILFRTKSNEFYV